MLFTTHTLLHLCLTPTGNILRLVWTEVSKVHFSYLSVQQHLRTTVYIGTVPVNIQYAPLYHRHFDIFHILKILLELSVFLCLLIDSNFGGNILAWHYIICIYQLSTELRKIHNHIRQENGSSGTTGGYFVCSFRLTCFLSRLTVG